MQIVIDIPEEEYKCVQITGCISNKTCISNAIYNATPLPKGHGDLIDINSLVTKLEAWDYKTNGIPNYAWKCIKDAQVIIKADKESEA